MIGVASLLAAVTVGLLVTRVAAVALRTTGLSQDMARFQARSAFSGVGFTTVEAEDIVNHPARRQIVQTLMVLSSAGVVTTLGTLMLSFAGGPGYHQTAARAGVLVMGLFVIWRLACSRWVDVRLSRVIERALKRWTDLDVQDYVRLLHITGDYSIAEIGIERGDWLEGRSIHDLRLAREGAVVLGIRKASGHYAGAPTLDTLVSAGDTVIVYGRTDALDELQARPAGPAGDAAHREASVRHEQALEAEAVEAARSEVDT